MSVRRNPHGMRRNFSETVARTSFTNVKDLIATDPLIQINASRSELLTLPRVLARSLTRQGFPHAQRFHDADDRAN
jgi:hypothetical protein